MRNTKNLGLIMVIGIFLGLGCFSPYPSGVDFLMVRHGCITNDGSKIALYDFFKDFGSRTNSNKLDKYRLILDGKTGKVIWKDLTSSDRLVCAEDNSILSISNTEAAWIEGGKKIVFSKPTDNNAINFIGMTDKDTVVREFRPYSLVKLRKSNSYSSEKHFSSFPTFLIDKFGVNETKIITLSESDLPGVFKHDQFQYYFENNQMIVQAGEKLYAVDVVSGKVKVLFESFKDFQKSQWKYDKYGAIDTTNSYANGVLEIYEGSGDESKIVNRINEKDVDANVIHIIDCCNNGLNLLHWGADGNSLRVSQIDHLTGKVIWKSDSLLYYPSQNKESGK